ncbi:MAG TPA: GatB/YqeY domain-containing protein [Allosphingosinicella sp.]|jgi:hypothetical protein
MIRDEIKTALVTAMKAGEKSRVATIRLIQSSIKNRDIELRGKGNPPEDDLLVTEVLQKMVKQRRESIDMYVKGGRQELADAEAAEIGVIEDFLPSQMSDDELAAAIDAVAAETGAATIKDMGKVMAALKDRHAGQIDMSKAGAMVRAKLAG